MVVKDVIADAFLQQILTRPREYDVIATLNLNGDYISDALAAQVGGIGIAPGANINYLTGHAIFEATHGTAPKYAGQDKVNPGSVILSGEMMFRYLGWDEAADLIITSLEKTIAQKRVTYDFERLMAGATLLKTSEFGNAMVENMCVEAAHSRPLSRSISRRSRFVGRPFSGTNAACSVLSCSAIASRAARLSGRSSYSPTATDGGPAVRRKRLHHHRVLVRPEPHPHLVAHLERSGALRPVAVHLHLPAADRFRGERARLEEARRPEPLVQPDPLVVGLLVLCSHA